GQRGVCHALTPHPGTGFTVTCAHDAGRPAGRGKRPDTALLRTARLAVAGLARYGFTPEAQQISLDLIDASQPFGGRLPELFYRFDRTDFPRPMPYPTSSSPQAWAAAESRLVLRSLFRL